jgi:hypothetical protein
MNIFSLTILKHTDLEIFNLYHRKRVKKPANKSVQAPFLQVLLLIGKLAEESGSRTGAGRRTDIG